MPRHVLVPLDGADRSLGALEYALETFPNASLTALYVVDPARDSAEMDLERRGERVLERASERGADHGREIETELQTGLPHREILSRVVCTDVDHVVVGSHGESPVSRPFLGRVSEAVVRRSPITTTVVPESARSIRERDLPGRVLVPVDGSEQAEAALEYALEALPSGSRTALHVISLPFDPDRAAEGTYLDRIRTAHERSAAEVLESARAIADERGVGLETATAYGDPSEAILAEAAEGGFDQLVMGIHGRPLTARLFTGSVAERVARRAERTVTLVRGRPSTN
ncbi:universal stress protein [Natronolimnohabitans innermongolicus]|uniref:UspA domain-containing protein n=1 Tax=Natronolimnohabitans innermongolicus JCM 12255 TaxID=1227499 RepID=L9XAH0_9EURY|nr:universal stress protein [Natronolimnohabitans innermongolicus]ELY58715.1 UspA domain-containing protein [Natronolimnohabitans innermongolicus JCM 12255]